MEQTWRWFGDDDPISLDNVRQAGATGIVTALHHISTGEAWAPEEIAKRKDRITGGGLAWRVCESIPVHDSIKRGDRSATAYIAAWKDSLAALGRAGIPVVCYNFMPVVDWTRTDLNYLLANKGYALRFDMVEFVAYDVFVLKRPRAEYSYPETLVSQARARLSKMTESEIAKLESNVISGLPGGAEARTRDSIGALIASFNDVSEADMQRSLAAFLREVVPVAEEVGVRLAIHPDDPPFSLFGLPRVVSTADDVRNVLRAVDSPANGITMCTGSFGARADNDVVAMTAEFGPRINFAHLRNVTKEPDGSFYEAEHLDGDTDMVAVIELILREEKREERQAIPMRPDHGHLLADDIGRRTNPGYSYIGRLKGLAELRGVMRAVEKQLQFR
jgi:mannonate dehydratase